MKKISLLLPAFLLALALTLRAAATGDTSMGGAAKAAPYFDSSTIDLKALLPDPPADGSAVTKQEIDLILQKQAARTPEEVARIKREVHLDVWLFGDVLGPWFTEKKLPLTAAFFKRVDATEYPVILSAKKFWKRPTSSATGRADSSAD